MLMVLMILILYFDWKGLAFKVNLLFFFANLLFTLLFINEDLSFQGYGYFLACLLTLCVSLHLFLKR